MPTYDYLCPNNHRFEVIHSVTADGPTSCPVCGASPVRKAFTAPTIHFKGTGWAKKDRSSASRSSTRAAAASEGGSDPAPGSNRSDASSGSDAGSDKGSDKGSDRSSDKGGDTRSEPKPTSDSKGSADSAPASGGGKPKGSSGTGGATAAD